jgi:hypothetical protein
MPNRLQIPLSSMGRSSLAPDRDEADLVAIARRDGAAFALLHRAMSIRSTATAIGA